MVKDILIKYLDLGNGCFIKNDKVCETGKSFIKIKTLGMRAGLWLKAMYRRLKNILNLKETELFF